MDGKHVVFGRVIEGFDQVFTVMENAKKDNSDRPILPILIADCGIYLDDEPPAPYQSS